MSNLLTSSHLNIFSNLQYAFTNHTLQLIPNPHAISLEYSGNLIDNWHVSKVFQGSFKGISSVCSRVCQEFIKVFSRVCQRSFHFVFCFQKFVIAWQPLQYQSYPSRGRAWSPGCPVYPDAIIEYYKRKS